MATSQKILIITSSCHREQFSHFSGVPLGSCHLQWSQGAHFRGTSFNIQTTEDIHHNTFQGYWYCCLSCLSQHLGEKLPSECPWECLGGNREYVQFHVLNLLQPSYLFFSFFFYYLFNIYIFYLFTWLCWSCITPDLGSSFQHAGPLLFSWVMWDLILPLGRESRPSALGAQSLSHWTTRNVPTFLSF